MATRSDLVRTAMRMRRVAQGAVGLLLAGIGGGVWVLMTGRGGSGSVVVHVSGAGLPPVVASCILVVVGVLVGLALGSLVRLLRRVESGAAFRTGGDLRRFSRYLFLAVLTSVVLPTFSQLLLAEREVSASVEGGQVLMLVVTGLLFVVSRILDEAEALEDEHRQIV